MLLLSFAVGIAGCTSDGASDPAAGRECFPVKRVVDGDTFRIDIGGGRDDTVRLIGVDTPETVKPGSPVEPYGKEASDFTKKLLTGKTVCLEKDVEERDRYGRLLAYVYLEEDGTFVNELLLAEGYAQVLTVPPNVRFSDRFVEVQREARSAGRGLWGDPEASAEIGAAADAGGAAKASAGGGGGRGEGELPPGERDRDCGDFATQAEAQAFFEAAGGPERDPHRLDADGDGIACEGLRE